MKQKLFWSVIKLLFYNDKNALINIYFELRRLIHALGIPSTVHYNLPLHHLRLILRTEKISNIFFKKLLIIFQDPKRVF